ncbi:Gfo/Idh/MocA family protein [Microbacterium hominis]|uniref:Gfo/Idh/MocA family oxidoreductase n=1 Tax=Microbacterium hominis TaxID=162426 RepID=A0A7D4TFM0_9MICO|nr:Gfo/Idh/MocA family oxidoreductase [Microbacterium hominis]QKJ18661.1 Gfo/Idh/MocA family oxidoreductase [Microbacterium hominis]
MSLPRLGIAGVHGHGRSHVDAALALQRAGAVELVAVADPRGGGDVPDGTTVFADAEAMLAGIPLDVAVLSTPIPTHADLTLRALDAGAHVLLEKPPVVSGEEHRRVVQGAMDAGRGVQVGFQSLGSDGIDAARDLVASGAIGDLVHIGAVGQWSRSEEYWRRAPWAGHRVRAGRLVADGAATNPLAHALATALAIAGAAALDDVVAVDLDMYRANDIATDDTSSMLLTLASGTVVAAGLAVTAARRHEPYVLLRGTRGHALYWYTLDVLSLHPSGAHLPRTWVFPRAGLLADLVDYARTGSPLRVPLDATGAFTRVLESIVAAPAPASIGAAHIEVRRGGDESFRVVRGVEEWTERVAWEARTFAQLGAPWAAPAG